MGQAALRAASVFRHDAHTENLHRPGLQADANRLSNALSALGVARGDQVAVIAPQCAAAVVSPITIYQMGAEAVPQSMPFGPEALD